MNSVYEKSMDLNGQTLTLQFGKLAQQATSSVLATMGETTILVTVVAGKVRDDLDYFPLSVEYVEKLYAGGRIKGSKWLKKEGRPTDDAVLKGRLVDRSIRPLFPKAYKRDCQVIITVLTVDNVNSPEIVGAIAVSAALHVSSIPFMIPISTMRIGYIDGAYVVNPTNEQQMISELDLVVSSSKEKIMMIETRANQLPDEIVKQGLKEAKAANGKVIDFIESIRADIGVEKEVVLPDEQEEKLFAFIKENFRSEIDALIDMKSTKESSDPSLVKNIAVKVMEKAGEGVYQEAQVLGAIDVIAKKFIKARILSTKIRLDGRKLDQVRQLTIEAGVLPRVHGSGLFQRGETQVMTIVTLGGPQDSMLLESPEGEEERFYFHHYNMPPYSSGETGRMGSSSRREIGHGALAEKALIPVLPDLKDFPYAIRVVSEVMSSNGSTSMASTCGSTLALMDAGVPIKAPVSGIAMGLMANSDDDYVVLTDIAGIEDFSGEMDFKVTGTVAGVTAMQMDVKNMGLTDGMVDKIFAQSNDARMFVLNKMLAVISTPRSHMSKYAPKIVSVKVGIDKIGEIIGPGGKNIRGMSEQTGTTINIDDDGMVTITGVEQEGIDQAVAMISGMGKEPEVGEQYDGVVVRMMPFGAFVEIMPGKDGMIHVSKMGKGFVKNPEDVVKIGQSVKVRVIESDRPGRINLELLS